MKCPTDYRQPRDDLKTDPENRGQNASFETLLNFLA